jgi:hypothetical protein
MESVHALLQYVVHAVFRKSHNLINKFHYISLSQVYNLEQNMVCNTLYFCLPYVNIDKSLKSKLVHDSGRKKYQNINYVYGSTGEVRWKRGGT